MFILNHKTYIQPFFGYEKQIACCTYPARRYFPLRGIVNVAYLKLRSGAMLFFTTML